MALFGGGGGYNSDPNSTGTTNYQSQQSAPSGWGVNPSYSNQNTGSSGSVANNFDYLFNGASARTSGVGSNYLGMGGGPSVSMQPMKQMPTYNGPGGSFTQNQSGQGWTSGTGQQVNDLPGYLAMKQQQAQGANFTGWQGATQNAVGGEQQANQKYQRLLNDPNAVNQTAGYKFALDQGTQAIDRSAAAKGMTNSGNVLAELAKYGQGVASGLYQQELGNQQQNIQNQGQQVNQLSDLLRGSQQFGVQSGYYAPPMVNSAQNVQRPSGWY